MKITIIYPFIYLFTGIFLARSGLDAKWNIRWFASFLLTWVFIPFVIIHNIVYYENGVFFIMIAIIMIMAIMLLLALKSGADTISSLCFCYLNIGWLGLPVVLSLYGDRAGMVIIAAYVGSSIFGNSVGAGLFVKNASIRSRLVKILHSPPILSLVIGLCLIPFGAGFEASLALPYVMAKFLMSFCGMLILGLWMAQSQFFAKQFVQAARLTVARVFVFSILISLVVALGFYFHIGLITENLKTLYFIGLLPPAVNIVVLETYYLRSGESAALIATGTLISIGLIIFYGLVTTLLF